MANHGVPPPSWLNETYLENILISYFQSNIKVLAIEVTPGSKEGDNYACQVLRINIKYEAKDEKKEMFMISKIKPECESLKAADSTMDFFIIEGAVYNKLFPVIKQISPKLGEIAPACYHVDYEHKTLFLEDLGQKQYTMPARSQLLSKNEALLTMKTLAVLHGSSYKAVHKDETLKKTFEKTMWGSKPNELIGKWYKNAIKGLDKNVESYGLPEEWCKKLRGVGDRIKREYLKVCDFKEDHLNVICHGDLWLNNLMYHFTDGVLDDVLILDYQFTTYNSFAIDLHFILFSSTQADVLVSDLDELLETYFNKLKEIASEIPNLSFERVKKEFLERRFFGCIKGVYYRSAVYATKPLDIESIVAGGLDEMGFKNPAYIADLHKLVPFMEKLEFF